MEDVEELFVQIQHELNRREDFKHSTPRVLHEENTLRLQAKAAKAMHLQTKIFADRTQGIFSFPCGRVWDL